MASTVFFNGRQLTTPQVASAVDDSAMAPANPALGNNLVIVGQSDGGAPLTLIPLASPADALKKLVSGPLLTAAIKAFAPSTQTNSPQTVYAMSVGAKTPSTLAVKDSTQATAIALTTQQYGLGSNAVQVQIQTGSVTGKEVSLQMGNTLISQDNLARSAFTVQYVGAAASATMTVTAGTVVLAAPVGTVLATLALATFQTVAQLVTAINGVAGFEADVVSGSENTPALAGLDFVSNVDVRTAVYTATANLQAIIDWFNGNESGGLVTATRPANAGLVPANIGWTNLTGGTAPAPVMGDWTSALTALQTADVQWLAALSPLPGVWAAFDAHCQFMSSNAKERRWFGGPDVGTSETAFEAMPATINSDRGALCWPGYWDEDPISGNLTLYPPYMLAAMVAAGFAGLSPGQTMTNVELAVSGLEVYIAMPTDTDAIIQSGGLCARRDEDGTFIVVRAISTWLQDNNYNRVEISCGAAVDYTQRTVRAALKSLLGSDGAAGMGAGPITMSRAMDRAKSALIGLAKPPPNGPGALVGDSNSPAWSNLSASVTGDQISVTYQCSPVIPANFITVTASIVPYSGTATATAVSGTTQLAS